jgi:alkylation response protein AidB-like acyl-CoA dehydrogenase
VSLAREVFQAEHQELRESFGRFLDAEIVPHHLEWEAQGCIPREVLRRTGELGFLGPQVPERFGGAGVEDFRFNAVLNEEAARRGLMGYSLAITLQNDITLPYFMELTTEEQRERWLPGIARGELITGIAMTEPGTGSDLAAITTRATRGEDGGFRVSGAKTFITNGINADLLVTAVRTGTTGTHRDISLLILERGMEGFSRGRNLEKLGQHSQDTAELFFDETPVPAVNLVGEEGAGFRDMSRNLPQERLTIAIGAVAAARGALERTLEYVGERRAFGRPIGTFQASRFRMAELRTEVEVAEAFVDRCLAAHVAGRLGPDEAAMAKLWATEMVGRVTDGCVQLHGGYGYMTEYAVARAWADVRVLRIYGGTNEIMKEVIGRAMGLGEVK